MAPKPVVRRGCQPPPRSVAQLLLDISLARLLLTAVGGVLGGPVRVSLQWWSILWRLFLAARRSVLHALGFLAAPPHSRGLQQLGRGALEVRRWHLAAGERPLT